MKDNYTGLTPEEFQILGNRYSAFLNELNDVTKEPIKVFAPLAKNAIQDLHLIREASKDLQLKKDEEMKRAAQAREEEELKSKEAENTEAAEENAETEKET